MGSDPIGLKLPPEFTLLYASRQGLDLESGKYVFSEIDIMDIVPRHVY